MANSTNYYGSSYTGAQVDQFLSEADRMFNSTWQGDPEGTVTVVKELTSANTFLWTVSAKSLAATIAQKYVPLSALGNAGGVATLDSSGKIPAAQLPGGTYPAIASYASLSAFPTTGDANTMYYAQNTSLYYRWSSASSSYVKIPAATTLGTTAGTAYEGSAGQANADAITAIKAGFSSPSTQKALLLLGCSGSAYVSVDSNNLTVHVHGTVTIDNPISGTSVSIVYYHPSGEQGFCNGIAMGQVINASG